MKRVHHIIAKGKTATLKVTVELASNRGYSADRDSFIERANWVTSNLMQSISEGSDIPLTHIKQK